MAYSSYYAQYTSSPSQTAYIEQLLANLASSISQAEAARDLAQQYEAQAAAHAVEAQGYAGGVNMPSSVGQGLNFFRVKIDETGFEHRTPAQVIADIGAATSGHTHSEGDITGWLGYTPWHPGNDGPLSGLDADTVDGNEASAFATAGHGHAVATGGADGFMASGDKTKLDAIESAATADQSAAEILAALLGVDGTGSLLDADLLDGLEASAFSLVGHTHGGSAIIQGLHSQWIPARSMKPRLTNGPSVGSVESTTNKVMLETLDFDKNAAEYAQWMVRMPKSWDEGTVTFIPLWYWSGGTVGDCVWNLAAVALSDGDTADSAWGTAGVSTDGGVTADTIRHGAVSGAITIAGTPAEGDLVVFQVSRDAPAGGDTLNSDARLFGVLVLYTINAGDDS
jgi:hypothetical protein